MVKIIGTAVAAAAMLMASSAFAKDKAGDMACCAKNASNQQSCASLASLNLTADQKSKIEAWQSECVKAGCTKGSRQAFLKKAPSGFLLSLVGSGSGAVTGEGWFSELRR